MAHYCTLINITIVHEYFADGICRVLEFKPTATTQKLMQRNELLMRPIESGFCLIGDLHASSSLDDGLVLRFYAISRDPHFAFYTQELHENDAPLFYPLHFGQLGDLVSAPFIESDLFHEDEIMAKKINAPVCIIDIHFAQNSFDDFSGRAIDYVIRLHAKALHWKYYFFGELANFELEIQDLSSPSPIMFTNSNEAVAKNGKAFLSQIPITLSEAPKQRFQLKDKNNSGKVLLKRLPNAGVNRLGKERNLEGQSFLVAEIYINQ